MRFLQRICPRHGWLGWSYNTHRRRRWCRFCGHQQRRIRSSMLIEVATGGPIEAWVDVDHGLLYG